MSRVLMGSISTSRPAPAAIQRPRQVGFIGGLQARALNAFRCQARHHMHARAVQRLRVWRWPGQAAAELGFATWQAVPGRVHPHPSCPGGALKSTCCRPLVGKLLRQDLGVIGIGKEVLHCLEAVLRRGGETVQEGVLVVEHGQVGGEAGHGGFRSDLD